MIVIKSQGLVGKAINNPGRNRDETTGLFLKEYHPEAHDGMGLAVWTDDVAEALRFPTHGDAVEFAMQVPRNRPLRGDGRPNRPLTAFSLETESAP